MFVYHSIVIAFFVTTTWLAYPRSVWAAAVVPNITGVSNKPQLLARLETIDNAAATLAFERSLWANGSVTEEDFYRVPSDTSSLAAGSLLKLQLDANASAYALPPGTALSRILYQTKTLNGSLVPASAYILWPYAARSQPDGYAVVGFAHGSSGWLPECAPSHWINLNYEFRIPYLLALQGYVVVATDYVGLGVAKDGAGKPTAHPWLSSPSHANDVFYSIQAAQSAFKALSKHFVIIGHSQGGGTAWAAAQRQALSPAPGYLGSVALAPVTNFLEISEGRDVEDFYSRFFFAGISQAAATIFPGFFDAARFLTPAGLERIQLFQDVQGCAYVQSLFFNVSGLLKADWRSDFYVQSFQNLTRNGGKPIAGPLLVIQGEVDEIVPYPLTTKWINRTRELGYGSQLEYVTFPGVKHDGINYVSQRIWLHWIEEKFFESANCKNESKADVAKDNNGYRFSEQKPIRPLQFYLNDTNYILRLPSDI